MKHGGEPSLGSLPCVFQDARTAINAVRRTWEAAEGIPCLRHHPVSACVHAGSELSQCGRSPDGARNSLLLPGSVQSLSACWSRARMSGPARTEMMSSDFLRGIGLTRSHRKARRQRSFPNWKPRSILRPVVGAMWPSMRTGVTAFTVMPWAPASFGSSACSAKKSPIAVCAVMHRLPSRRHCSQRVRAGAMRRSPHRPRTSRPISTVKGWFARPVTFAVTSGLGLPPARLQPTHRL